MKELIFVCASEISRSPTAKRVFNDWLERDGLSKEYHASSAGALDGRKMAKEEVDEAHKIIAFDGMVATALEKNYPELMGNPKLIQLSVPDIYARDSEELVEIIRRFYDSKSWV